MSIPAAPDLAESWLELPDGRLFWLKGPCAIGRHSDNDLVLKENSVSRHQALIATGPDGYTVSDLHSSNGTYVNRAPVTRVTLLRDGDELHFGDSAMRFRRTRGVVSKSMTSLPERTRRITKVEERACWLLLADVDGYSALNAQFGSKTALQRFHAWVAGMRPLIERDEGNINSYVGNSIFAWWPATAAPAQVRNALASIAAWRPQSPVGFRVMLHHGSVLFTQSERGEELSGQDVNFVFRSEKVAKGFGAPAMLSESAAHTLQLDGHCKALGATTVDGIRGRFVFYAPPATFS